MCDASLSGLRDCVCLCAVVLEVGSGMSVSGGGLPGVYNTVQLHFHWGSTSSNGSEHTMNGRRYPMEVRGGDAGCTGGFGLNPKPFRWGGGGVGAKKSLC